MANAEWFREWFNSPYYHKLYFERNEAETAAFIRRLVDHLRIEPGSRLLDAGCGRGRHARIFAALGFDVSGVDISPASIDFALAQAEREFAPNLHFYVHDLRLPFWGNYFDYAFNFFTSFGYFRTRREHEAAIRTLSNSLKANGVMVFDYLNVHYSEDHFVPFEKKVIDGVTYTIKRHQDETHFYKNIHISDNAATDESEFTERVAKFSLGDFTEMLAYHDLYIHEVFGDYELNHYDASSSPRMIIIARKLERKKDDKEKRLYSDGRTTDGMT
jgi:cyclopropane fatty-acyl-phospholipid synthase-like methyltransferase